MKKYIKPSMGMIDVEMTSMVALSGYQTSADDSQVFTKEEQSWNDGSSFWGE